jgi:hypothetical protein
MKIFLLSSLLMFSTVSFADQVLLETKAGFRNCYTIADRVGCTEETSNWKLVEVKLAPPNEKDLHGHDKEIRSYLFGETRGVGSHKGHLFHYRIKVKQFTDNKKPIYDVRVSLWNKTSGEEEEITSSDVHRLKLEVNKWEKLNKMRLSGSSFTTDKLTFIPSLSMRPYVRSN